MKKHALLMGTLSLITLLAFLLCFERRENSFNRNEKRIVFVSPQLGAPVWEQARAGFQQAAGDFGFYGIWTGSKNCNLSDMKKKLKTSAYEHADGLITCPLTPEEFSEVFTQIKEEGIPLITIGVEADDTDLQTAYIGSDYQTLGLIQAQALHEQTGDHMRIGIIMSGLTASNQVTQVDILKDYISSLPDAQIIAYAEDYADPVIGKNEFLKMIDSHPEMNAVYVTSGDATSSYGRILREKGLEEKITLIGMDIIKENLNSVANGEIYGVMSQDFYQMGYLAGKYAYQAACGETVPPYTYTDSELVTKENVDAYLSPPEQ